MAAEGTVNVTGSATLNHAHESLRAALGVEAQHGREIDVGQDVAVEHDDEAAAGVAQEVGRVPDAAGRSQRLRLDGVVEPDTPVGAVAHGPPDLVHEIGARQHGASDPVPAQQGQLVGQERDIEQRDDRLRARARQGAQARALAPGQDDGGYVPGVQGCASLMSITGMPSRIG